MSALRFLRACRLERSAPAVVFPFIGAALGASHWSWSFLLAALAWLPCYVGGSLVNDLCDLRIDAANKPHLPLPSGQVSAGAMKVGAVVLATAAAGLALSVSLPGGALLLLATILSWSYSARFKLTGFPGELLASIAIGLSVASGYLLSHPTLASVSIALTAVMIAHLVGATVWMTIFDIEGDRLAGSRTGAVVWGPDRARQLVLLIWALAAVGSVVAATLVGLGRPWVVVLAGLDALVLVEIHRGIVAGDRDRRIANVLNLQVVLVCLVFLVGSLDV